jgi:hypothetical protein
MYRPGDSVTLTPTGLWKMDTFFGLGDLPLETWRPEVCYVDDRDQPPIVYVGFRDQYMALYRHPVTGRKRWGFIKNDLLPAESVHSRRWP